MLVPVSTPEVPAEFELRALRLSLNSPVVEVDSLPVGPANAAVALYAASAGLRVVLALRSERGGKRVFYAAEEEEEAAGGFLDAALSFAERMGFLFEDDEVETRGEAGPEEGARIWAAFTGCAEPSRSDVPSEAVAAPRLLASSRTLTKFRLRLDEAAESRVPAARIQLLGRF